MLRDTKAFIFDLDDTLYPQKEYTRQCLLATAPYISELSDVDEATIKNSLNEILDKKGIEYRYIYNDLFEKIDFDGREHLKHILEIFWAYEPKLELFENSLDILNALKSSYRIALLTDGHEKVQNYKLKELNLDDFFEEVLITFTLGEENRKPSTMPYEIMLEKLGLEPFECVYVGNDPKRDFIACKKLGMKSLRINQGDYKDLFLGQEYDADFCVNDIIEIVDLLKN